MLPHTTVTPKQSTGTERGRGQKTRRVLPAQNHSNYRRTDRNNAIPSYRYTKLALDQELTVLEEDVSGLDVPVNYHSIVQELDR